MNFLLKNVAAIGILALTAVSASAELKIALGGGWDGKKVPAGQQCVLHGGKGKTPPMTVTGIPANTKFLIVEFNDRDFGPLSSKGGHGSLAFSVKGGTANLPAVAGMTNKLPKGVQVYKPARSTGKYASAGYLPPCSGGRGNRYFADVKAVDAKGKTLDKGRVQMGRY